MTRLLVMHWPSVLASANPLRKGQRFVRPSRKDAGRDLCGRRDGVFQVSRTKPCAQFEPFIAETEHGHRLSTELDGCEFKGRFVGHGPFPFVRGPMISLIRQELRRAVIFAAFIGRSLCDASEMRCLISASVAPYQYLARCARA